MTKNLDDIKKNIIFDLSQKDWKYKGILFAQGDNEFVTDSAGAPPMPKDYIVGILALIWVDENGIWHSKVRFKFPSGNKQVVSHKFSPESEEGVNINETYILQYLYQMPMKNKTWLPNPDGTGLGILKLTEGADVFESIEVIKND